MLHGQWGDQWGGLLTYDLSLLFRALDTGCGYPPFEEPPRITMVTMAKTPFTLMTFARNLQFNSGCAIYIYIYIFHMLFPCFPHDLENPPRSTLW